MKVNGSLLKFRFHISALSICEYDVEDGIVIIEGLKYYSDSLGRKKELFL